MVKWVKSKTLDSPRCAGGTHQPAFAKDTVDVRGFALAGHLYVPAERKGIPLQSRRYLNRLV
jgi:hypothetical protein